MNMKMQTFAAKAHGYIFAVAKAKGETYSLIISDIDIFLFFLIKSVELLLADHYMFQKKIMQISTLKLKLYESTNGRYFFSGLLLVTQKVQEVLSLDQILTIYVTIRTIAETKEGIDYLQILTTGQGEKMYFIDQLSQEMIESGKFKEEDNYCVLMFSDEY